MSAEPAIIIRFDESERVHLPGETLSGDYWIESLPPDQLKGIEVCVLWSTEGKGDEDLDIHEFWRRDVDDDHAIDPSRPDRFETVLPNSPLSYEGFIVKIRWYVRVRAFLHRGKDLIGQRMFQLGEVPPTRTVSPGD